ncbi:hypothetical protein GW17_00039351, partial [Ensete ventricosum]
RCCLRRLAAAVFTNVAVAWISISPLPYLVSLSSPPRCCCLRRRRCRLDYVVDTRLSLRRRSLQLVAVTAVAVVATPLVDGSMNLKKEVERLHNENTELNAEVQRLLNENAELRAKLEKLQQDKSRSS